MRTLAALALLAATAACGTMMGEATVSDPPVTAGPPAAPPARIWVGDFTADEGAVKRQGGILGAAEEVAEERPRILGGGGGPLQRRLESDTPDAADVSDQLASAIVDGLTAQNLGVPVERLQRGVTPASGWVVHGQLLSVDPGNRVQRAVIGFGAGEATTEVAVDVDRVDAGGSPHTVLRFGGTSDSGKMPGAVVTMNPYVAAAKFVLGRQATARDVHQLGEAIAGEIATEARAARAR